MPHLTKRELAFLCAKHEGLVRQVAHRWSGNCPESFEDLCQIGKIGLIKALRQYDPDKGGFASYAKSFIDGAIKHFLRDHWGGHVRINRQDIELYDTVNKRKRELERQGIIRDEYQIAKVCAKRKNFTPADWQKIKEARYRKQMIPVEDMHKDIPLIEEEEGEYSPLYSVLRGFPLRHTKILEAYYLQQLRIDAIAEEHALAVGDVESIIERATTKLRNAREHSNACN